MKKYWLLVVCSLFIVNTKLIAQTTSENELDYKKFKMYFRFIQRMD